MTALGTPIRVIRNWTFPVTFHDRYRPPTKFETSRESSVQPVAGSISSIRWERPFAFQSTMYSETRWVLPSVRSTSIVNGVATCHAAARRGELADHGSARGSVVVAAH